MNEKRRKIIVFACLPAVVVWAVLNLGSSKDQAPPETPRTIEPLKAEPLSSAFVAAVDTARIAALDWGRDPFAVATKKRTRTTPQLTWTVTGIMFNPTNPIAYVNGRPVKVGDQVDQAEVIEIAKESVTLKYQGNRFKITVTKG